MTAAYYRHKLQGHIVEASGAQPKGHDIFGGTVIFSPPDPDSIALGTYSQVWMRAAFDKVNTPAIVAQPVVETVESLQLELEMLRVALGIEPEPLDTLPDRMLRAATTFRKLYDKVKEWENE